MAKFKPQVTFSIMPYRDGNLKWHTSKTIIYKTYRALKRDIDRLTKESWDVTLHITRSRRGEGGEWFETWINGKLTNEGWM